METQWLPVSLVVWITALAGTLDARQQVRFVALCTGLLFARGRRTVASWLRLWRGRDYKRDYYLLGSVGRKALAIAGVLLRILLKRLPGDGPGTPLVFAIDDSPTKRYGPHVEGAGKHHNPTPGPAGSPFLYGHVWVCLARLVRHSLWGAIALPILSHLYIRAKDVGWMAAYYGWQFHTKLELAAAQIEWLVQQLGPDHPPIWVVTDGAYVKRPFLKRVLAAGVTVISRLRCDAALWSLPPVVDPGQKKGRGRPPKYGKDRIDLARRAAQTRGWQTGLFSLYGRLVVKKYKTFLATYKPVGGVIRVVLVREPDRWVAYFSTDPDLSVASILETVADRSALEQVFHDVKEVHGAGQQQLRHVWANVGAWNLIGWWHTLVELWAWDRPQSRLRDRSDSPWDKPERRPSHANRCQELRREALQEEYSSLPSVGGLRQKSAGSFSASCAESHEADSSGKVQNELKEPQVKRQFLLRNPPMRSEPRPQQRPKALNRVDMDFAKSIPILVAGELPGRVTHGVVGIAPFGQPTVNVIFIGIDNSSFSDRSFDQWGDRVLLHVREHRDDNLAATLHHAEDRRFLLLQRSSAPFTLQPTAAPGPLFFLTSSGLPLCPATT